MLGNKLFLVAVLFLSMGTCSLSFAGNEGRGGVPEDVTIEAFTKYIEGEGLKLSVRHYAETLDLSQVTSPEDKDVRPLLEKMVAGGNLLKDINESPYVAGIEKCKSSDERDSDNPESTNPKVRAWTHTGKNGVANIGGKICFDVAKLVEDYLRRGFRSLSPEAKLSALETAALEMSSLTFHEIFHHFQNAATSNDPNQNAALIAEQEKEANEVGGFVLRRYGFEALPVLKFAGNCAGGVCSTPDPWKPYRDQFNQGQPFDPKTSLGQKRTLFVNANHPVSGDPNDPLRANWAFQLGFDSTEIVTHADVSEWSSYWVNPDKYAKSCQRKHTLKKCTSYSLDQMRDDLKRQPAIQAENGEYRVYNSSKVKDKIVRVRYTLRENGYYIFVKIEVCDDAGNWNETGYDFVNVNRDLITDFN